MDTENLISLLLNTLSSKQTTLLSKSPKFFDCRVTSLNPFMITEDYLFAFPVQMTDQIISLLKAANFNRVSLNIKIRFSRFSFKFEEHSNHLVLFLKIEDPLFFVLKDFEIVRCGLKVEGIEKCEEIQKAAFERFGLGLKAEQNLLMSFCSLNKRAKEGTDESYADLKNVL